MVTKQKINKGRDRKIRVTFEMPALDGCNCLYLVGKFNEAYESVYRMQRADDGTWFLALELESGHDYQYRYRTDNGIWHTDPLAKRYVPDCDGSASAVLRV